MLLSGRLSIHDAPGDLATNITNFAFEIPNARLAGVGLDESLKTGVRERKLPLRDARFLELFCNQEALGDFQFLELRVAGETDYFHAILQGRRNGVKHVGGRNEKDLA